MDIEYVEKNLDFYDLKKEILIMLNYDTTPWQVTKLNILSTIDNIPREKRGCCKV